MFDFGIEFVDFYRFEFSQEYGYLRLSDKARKTVSHHFLLRFWVAQLCKMVRFGAIAGQEWRKFTIFSKNMNLFFKIFKVLSSAMWR